jgi:hypothetical protein
MPESKLVAAIARHELKTLKTLHFVEGMLSVKSSGYDRQNGLAALFLSA